MHGFTCNFISGKSKDSVGFAGIFKRSITDVIFFRSKNIEIII